MKDRLIRMLDKEQGIRMFAADTTQLVEQARILHGLSPIATAALGRALTAGVMMGRMLKNDTDRITMQIKGDGPLGGLIVCADQMGRAKGYVNNPEVYLDANKNGKLDVGGAIGEGQLNIAKDIGLKEPYVGFTPLVSGEIGEDLAYYFYKSEQTPSIVALGVLVDKDGKVINSGGFIIQIMPDAEESVIERLENNLKGISSVTEYLKQGIKIDDVVRKVVDNERAQITDEIGPQYICDCNSQRVERAIISLGKQEAEKIAEKEGMIEIECYFCLKKYQYGIENVKKLF